MHIPLAFFLFIFLFSNLYLVIALEPHPAALAAAAAAEAAGVPEDTRPQCMVCFDHFTPGTLKQLATQYQYPCKKPKDGNAHFEDCCRDCLHTIIERAREKRCPKCRAVLHHLSKYYSQNVMRERIVYTWSMVKILNSMFHHFAFQPLQTSTFVEMNMKSVKELSYTDEFVDAVELLETGGVYLHNNQTTSERFLYVVENMGGLGLDSISNTIFAIHLAKRKVVLVDFFLSNTTDAYPKELTYPFTPSGDVLEEAQRQEQNLLALKHSATATYRSGFSPDPATNRVMEKIVRDAPAKENLDLRRYFRSLQRRGESTTNEISAILDIEYHERRVGDILERYLAVVRSSGPHVDTTIHAISPKGETVIVWNDRSFAPNFPSQIEWGFEPHNCEQILQKFQNDALASPIATGLHHTPPLFLHRSQLNAKLVSFVSQSRKVTSSEAFLLDLNLRDGEDADLYAEMEREGSFLRYEERLHPSGFGYVVMRYLSLQKANLPLSLSEPKCQVVYQISPKNAYVAVLAVLMNQFLPVLDNAFDQDLNLVPEYSNADELNAHAQRLLEASIETRNTPFTLVKDYNRLIQNYVMEGRNGEPFDTSILSSLDAAHFDENARRSRANASGSRPVCPGCGSSACGNARRIARDNPSVFRFPDQVTMNFRETENGIDRTLVFGTGENANSFHIDKNGVATGTSPTPEELRRKEHDALTQGQIVLYKRETENGLERILSITRREKNPYFTSEFMFTTAVFGITEKGHSASMMVQQSIVVSFSADFSCPYDREETFYPEQVRPGVQESMELQKYDHVDGIPFHSNELYAQNLAKFIRQARFFRHNMETDTIPYRGSLLDNEDMHGSDIYLTIQRHQMEVRRWLVLKLPLRGVALALDNSPTVFAISPIGTTLLVENVGDWPFTPEGTLAEEWRQRSSEGLAQFHQRRQSDIPTAFSFHLPFNRQLEALVRSRRSGRYDGVFRPPQPTSDSIIQREAKELQKGFIFYDEKEEDNMVKRTLIIMRFIEEEEKQVYDTKITSISPSGATKLTFYELQYAPYVPDPLPYAYAPDNTLLQAWQNKSLEKEYAGEFKGYSYTNDLFIGKDAAVRKAIELKLRHFVPSEKRHYIHDLKDRRMTLSKEEMTQEQYEKIQDLESLEENGVILRSKMDGYIGKRWIIRELELSRTSITRETILLAAAVHSNGKIVLVKCERNGRIMDDELPWPFSSSGQVLPQYTNFNHPTSLHLQKQYRELVPLYSKLSSSYALTRAIEDVIKRPLYIARGGYKYFIPTNARFFLSRGLPDRDQREVTAFMEGNRILIRQEVRHENGQVEIRRWMIIARLQLATDEYPAHFDFEIQAIHELGPVHLVLHQKGIVIAKLKDFPWPFLRDGELEEEWVDKFIQVEISKELTTYKHSFDYPLDQDFQTTEHLEKMLRMPRKSIVFGEQDSFSISLENGQAKCNVRLVNGIVQRKLSVIRTAQEEEYAFAFKVRQVFSISPEGTTLVVLRRKAIIFSPVTDTPWGFDDSTLEVLPAWSSSLIPWSASPELTGYSFRESSSGVDNFSPVPEVNVILEHNGP